MKSLSSIFSFLLLFGFAQARETLTWSDGKLTKEADLIVIATPTAVRDTEERTTFPDVYQSDSSAYPRPIRAIGVETILAISSVLKGQLDAKIIVFHHLREAGSHELINGPCLVSFDPKEKKSYLMFLKREADGRYASLTGQTDPDAGVMVVGHDPALVGQAALAAPSDRELKLEQRLSEAMRDLKVAQDTQAKLEKELEVAKQAEKAKPLNQSP